MNISLLLHCQSTLGLSEITSPLGWLYYGLLSYIPLYPALSPILYIYNIYIYISVYPSISSLNHH